MRILIIFFLLFSIFILTNCKNEKNSKIKQENSILKKNNYGKISGNSVLFLRLNKKKFDSLKNEDGIYEVDSDFGFAIQNTIDSLKSNSKFKNLKTKITTERYFEIEDCKNCPLIINRYSIYYGIILTAPKKEVKIISGVQALNYLQIIEEYYE